MFQLQYLFKLTPQLGQVIQNQALSQSTIN